MKGIRVATHAASCLVVVVAVLVLNASSASATLLAAHHMVPANGSTPVAKSHPLLAKLLAAKHPFMSGYHGMTWLGNAGTAADPSLGSTTTGAGGRRMLTVGPLLAGAAGAVNGAVQPKFASMSGLALAMGMPQVAGAINGMAASATAATGMVMGVMNKPMLAGPMLGRRMLTVGPLMSMGAGAAGAANAAIQPKFASMSGLALAMGMPQMAGAINGMAASATAATGMVMGAMNNPMLAGPMLGRRLLTGPLGGFLKGKFEKKQDTQPAAPSVIIVPAPQSAAPAAPQTAAPAVAAPAVQPMYIPAPAPAAQPTSVNVNLNVNQYQQQPTVIPVPAPAPAPQGKLAALAAKWG